MVPTGETAQVYLNENRQGVVTCVHCGVKRIINMSNYTDHHLGGKSLKVKCNTCTKIFHISFNFRRYRRINVDLSGKISCVNTREKISDIKIASISVGGIGFFIKDTSCLEKDKIYEVTFILDDDKSSIIYEEVIIKRIDGHFVGAEFYHNDKYNYELDFYIMSELWDA